MNGSARVVIENNIAKVILGLIAQKTLAIGDLLRGDLCSLFVWVRQGNLPRNQRI
jgi:hypothetical protein